MIFSYFLGVLSGLLYAVSFAGIGIWPLAFVAWVPLIVALRNKTPMQAVKIGVLQGTVMNVTGFYWLNEMLMQFSGFPTALCALFLVLLCLAQGGGRAAVMTWLYSRATLNGWSWRFAFVAAFVASELVVPALFEWHLAASLHSVPVMIQFAELGGPILVGLVIVIANLSIAEPIMAMLDRRKISVMTAALGPAAIFLALGFGYWRIGVIDARAKASDSASVGIVQGNLGLIQKREDPGEGLRRHFLLTEGLRKSGADFVVWSESSVTFAVPENLANQFLRDRVASKLHLPAIFGGVLFRMGPTGERWFNTAFASDADGKLTSRYDKQYLLAFGEYLPFADTFPILNEWSPNSGKFSAGTSLEPLILNVKGVERRIAPLICYEDILPRFTNKIVSHSDPELIVNITNDAWFGDTTEPWEHLALAKFRAVEHRRYLVRATNSGVSAIVDAVGRSVVESGTFKSETLQGKVHFMRAKTVYEQLGDTPWAFVSLLAFAGAFVPRKKQS